MPHCVFPQPSEICWDEKNTKKNELMQPLMPLYLNAWSKNTKEQFTVIQNPFLISTFYPCERIHYSTALIAVSIYFKICSNIIVELDKKIEIYFGVGLHRKITSVLADNKFILTNISKYYNSAPHQSQLLFSWNTVEPGGWRLRRDWYPCCYSAPVGQRRNAGIFVNCEIQFMSPFSPF